MRDTWAKSQRRSVLRPVAIWTVVAGGTLLPAHAMDDSAQFALGQKLFSQGVVPSCAVCHTLRAAGAEGAIGPVLDELKPDAERVTKVLLNGLGQMPSYKDKLSPAEIAALSHFVAKSSGGTK